MRGYPSAVFRTMLKCLLQLLLLISPRVLFELTEQALVCLEWLLDEVKVPGNQIKAITGGRIT